jgi:hypothetical protein
VALFKKRESTPPGEPGRRRRRAEAGFLRTVGSGGIVGVGTALGAILGSQDVRSWVTGLVVALVSLVLGAVLRAIVKP